MPRMVLQAAPKFQPVPSATLLAKAISPSQATLVTLSASIPLYRLCGCSQTTYNAAMQQHGQTSQCLTKPQAVQTLGSTLPNAS